MGEPAPFGQGASLRQREIRAHARQALAGDEGEKARSGIHLEQDLQMEIKWGLSGGRGLRKGHFCLSR